MRVRRVLTLRVTGHKYKVVEIYWLKQNYLFYQFYVKFALVGSATREFSQD